LTILFVHIDDGYQEKVQPWRSGRAGRKPKLSVSIDLHVTFYFNRN